MSLEKRELCRKSGLFLFAAYGCAMMERRTPSGMYVYTAVNLTTGEAEAERGKLR